MGSSEIYDFNHETILDLLRKFDMINSTVFAHYRRADIFISSPCLKDCAELGRMMEKLLYYKLIKDTGFWKEHVASTESPYLRGANSLLKLRPE